MIKVNLLPFGVAARLGYQTAADTTAGLMAERPKWLSRLVGRERQAPRVPAGVRVYAVGDIHGRFDLLQKLLERVRTDAADSTDRKILIFLGDYVDRGPQSKEVLDCLVALDWPDWEIVALRGNHEQILLDYCDNAAVYRVWRDFGGAETLVSYGVKPPGFEGRAEYARAYTEFTQRIPERHLAYLRALPHSHVVGDYLFVHAGVRPSLAINKQSPDDLMWIRDEFLFSNRALEKVVVHGHSPAPRPVVKANRIGVDTGAYATDCLTAVVLHGESCTFLSTAEAVGSR